MASHTASSTPAAGAKVKQLFPNYPDMSTTTQANAFSPGIHSLEDLQFGGNSTTHSASSIKTAVGVYADPKDAARTTTLYMMPKQLKHSGQSVVFQNLEPSMSESRRSSGLVWRQVAWANFLLTMTQLYPAFSYELWSDIWWSERKHQYFTHLLRIYEARFSGDMNSRGSNLADDHAISASQAEPSSTAEEQLPSSPCTETTTLTTSPLPLSIVAQPSRRSVTDDISQRPPIIVNELQPSIKLWEDFDNLRDEFQSRR